MAVFFLACCCQQTLRGPWAWSNPSAHDMYEADALCDRVAIIHDGKLAAMDTPEALKARVANGSGKAVTLEEVFMALTGKQLVSETDAVEAV